MVDGKNKLYRGGFRDAVSAARLYDKASIQLRGLGVSCEVYNRQIRISVTQRKK